MGLLQERSFMIDHRMVISWDMHILQELLSTGIHISLLVSTYPIILGLMNIILVSLSKTIILLVIYSFNKILKVFFIIWTCSTLFHVNLILHPLHFVIKNFTYEIELPPSGKKIGLKLLEDEYFTIPYVIDAITN